MKRFRRCGDEECCFFVGPRPDGTGAYTWWPNGKIEKFEKLVDKVERKVDDVGSKTVMGE